MKDLWSYPETQKTALTLPWQPYKTETDKGFVVYPYSGTLGNIFLW